MPTQALPCYQVDAFTRTRFAGNPAAVCLLERWLPDPVLQAIAAENALPETAFLVPNPNDEDFQLRWFTPAVEVDLCGHATLAAAFVLLAQLHHDRDRVRFHSQSGPLTVQRSGERYTLDLPARPPVPSDMPPGLAEAMRCQPLAALKARDWLLLLPNAAAVRELEPDLAALARLPDIFGVIVTAQADAHDPDDLDFVSRFFAPAQGIPEDPVTGSAHCTLAPYWSNRLARPTLRARQLSPRGGELTCTLSGDRVHLSGHAVLTRTGHILVDA
jgi:PhzF family phenazine biosynthesis protein